MTTQSSSPQVDLRARTAAGVNGQVVLLARLLMESESVSMAALGSLKLFHQINHGIVKQTYHTSAGHTG